MVRVEWPAANQVTSLDPRYEPLEKLLDANDWKGIATQLGPLGEVGQLPPNLGLVGSLRGVARALHLL